MKNKGYTMIEAVVAMFLVVVMVGAVFSALMSGRRAITTSSEKEELFYSLHSAYGMYKDCRDNPNCFLTTQDCSWSLDNGTYSGYTSLKECNKLFTFNFQNLCKAATNVDNFLGYLEGVPSQNSDVMFFSSSTGSNYDDVQYDLFGLQGFYTIDILANCQGDDQ